MLHGKTLITTDTSLEAILEAIKKEAYQQGRKDAIEEIEKEQKEEGEQK